MSHSKPHAVILEDECIFGAKDMGSIQSLAVSDWVRLLFRASRVSGEWHAPRIKGLTTTTHCGKSLDGPLEVAREDRAEREGRCSTCATRLTPPKVLGAAVKKATARKAAAKKSGSNPAAKRKSSSAPVAPRSET